MRDEPIVCRYIRKGRHIFARCDDLDVSVGPYMDRDDAEVAIVREVKKVLDLDELSCFRHEATEVE